MRLFVGVPRNKVYQQAVERVRELLTRLAPEVFRDLNQPWLAKRRAIEATGIIERQEESAATDPLGYVGDKGASFTCAHTDTCPSRIQPAFSQRMRKRTYQPFGWFHPLAP